MCGVDDPSLGAKVTCTSFPAVRVVRHRCLGVSEVVGLRQLMERAVMHYVAWSMTFEACWFTVICGWRGINKWLEVMVLIQGVVCSCLVIEGQSVADLIFYILV